MKQNHILVAQPQPVKNTTKLLREKTTEINDKPTCISKRHQKTDQLKITNKKKRNKSIYCSEQVQHTS